MAGKKISRNAPCPCGSGKKFKHCCYGKDRPAAPRLPRPRHGTAAGLALLGPFRVVDARLKAIAAATPGNAQWKAMVERLTDTTAAEERMEAYKAVRQAGVLPHDASFFLFGHAIQWLPSSEDLDRHEVETLRRFGLDDLADLHTRDPLEYERRYERGRQFFYGPPDAELARNLKERGIID